MKSKVYLALLAAIVAVGMVACSGGGAGGGSSKDTNTIAAKVAPLGDDVAFGKFKNPVNVHIAMMVDPTDKTLPAGDTAGNNEYTRYLKDKYNINVIVDWTAAQWDPYNQKVSLAIASGKLPDALIFNDRTYMTKAASAGLLYNISTLFRQYASKQVLDLMATTGGMGVANASYNDQMVSLPNTTTNADGVIQAFVRKDWLDKLKLAEPKTLADFENVAKAFVKAKLAGPATIGIVGPAKDTNLYCDFLNSSNLRGGFDPVFAAYDAYPGFWVDNNGTVEYGTINPNTKKALGTLAKWYKEGLIDAEMGTRDNNMEPVNANQVGIFFGPWWEIGYGNLDSYKNDPKTNWKAYPVYTDDGKWFVHMKTTGTYYTGISKKASPDVVKALIIMNNALVRDEQTFDRSVAISWYPLRNVMAPADEMEYTYNALMKILKGQAKPEEFMAPGSVYKNLANDAKQVQSIVKPPFDNINIGNYDQKKDVGEFQRLLATFVGDKPFAAIPIDKKVYSVTYSQTPTMLLKWANLWKLEQQATLGIILGKQPLDSFDKFVSDWKAQGGDDITKEVQAMAKK
jgi:multiple sugar transport system substrate-binding protein/putative aldouronate transport system substrate-binding protein